MLEVLLPRRRPQRQGVLIARPHPVIAFDSRRVTCSVCRCLSMRRHAARARSAWVDGALSVTWCDATRAPFQSIGIGIGRRVSWRRASNLKASLWTAVSRLISLECSARACVLHGSQRHLFAFARLSVRRSAPHTTSQNVSDVRASHTTAQNVSDRTFALATS